LKGLGRQAELLRTGIRTLGGALIGAATVGGLGALIDRSISAADAIGKTADKIGVGVEALQELRFAAKASGVEQQTLDMALQRFTRRAAEAAQGTGEAKDALAQMGIALRDQSGNLRRSEDLLGDVADAFARIEDPAERVRLDFKLFDSEGVALVNLLRGGSGALEEMRERARDLGIVDLPGETATTSYWNEASLGRGAWLYTQSGRLVRSTVEPHPPELIRAGGREVEAKRYALAGDIDCDLWYHQGR
jgi:hypothetical protein